MKRIQDKIKDLIEPQSFEQVGNYADDPARALAAYRFTDVTSDMLSRWLDTLADMSRGGGAALALAGARGVGKSHTLSVFGALAGSERLRSSVGDAHVATSAARLTGRRCAVVSVERGTRPTLAGEVAAAFARVFGGGEAQWNGDPSEMLAVAASRAAGETLVLLVDTAFNRPARVARDDGPPLGDLAVAARASNAFVALALDDDIAGADGANVALAATYRIDYLDPENLFRVAEQFVLRKKPQGRSRVRDIYNELRACVPHFNWSEARFASLYPVHPLVAEMAAGVRLYVPGFAFLPFAAGVAAQAAARPALSLVLLDEVFDATEAALRRSPELEAAFAAYDRLTANCVNRLPVMQRHQARLILKSLFVLSLDGRGATAGELCAALLLTDELAEGGAVRQIEEILSRFAAESGPSDLLRAADAEGRPRYHFRTPVSHAHDAPIERPPAVYESTPPPVETAPTLAEASQPHVTSSEAAGAEVADVTGIGAEVAQPFDSAREPETAESVWADLAADETLWDKKPDAGATRVSGEDAPAEQGARDSAGEGGAAPDISSRPSTAEGMRAVNNLSDENAAADELTVWARLLTGRESLASVESPAGREEARAALAEWLEEWRSLGLAEKFAALPTVRLTTLAGRYEADVARSFGRAARAAEEALTGRITLEESLERVGGAFRNSARVFAERTKQLEDFRAFVEGFGRRECMRVYLAHADTTGLDEIETARRELSKVAADPNSLLDAEQRERFVKLWHVFHERYVEHYAAAHERAVTEGRERGELWEVRRGALWREFELLARLPVMSAHVWRQAEESLRRAAGPRCDLDVRALLADRPVCVCRFRLGDAGERSAEELRETAARGVAVYRRTLLLLGGHLAIGLDALARREEDEAEARRARALSSAFAQERLPERLTRADVRLIESALRRTPPPPVRVSAPDPEQRPRTREELRARLESWLEELPERPVLIEVV